MLADVRGKESRVGENHHALDRVFEVEYVPVDLHAGGEEDESRGPVEDGAVLEIQGSVSVLYLDEKKERISSL